MLDLIIDYNQERLWWMELFAKFWPKAWIYDLAEMADRVLHTFG